MTKDDLLDRFTFHPPGTDATRLRHAEIRNRCHALAAYLNDELPEGREKAVTITKIEEAMFWGNAALARAA